MRRHLAAAAALLVLAVPGAQASSISAAVPRVSPSQAYLWLNSFSVSSGSGHAFIEFGTTTSYGTVLDWGPVTGTGSGFASLDQEFVPGTTYHLRARLEEPGVTTTGPDLVFTTPPLGGAILNLPAETLSSTTTTLLSGITPERFPFQTCADMTPPLPGSATSTRYRAYAVTNVAAAGGCATVQLVSTCQSVQVGAYTGAFGGTAYDPATAASNGSTNDFREFQFPVAADGTFTVVVSDDGTCGTPYALRVYSTSVVPPTATTAATAAIGPRSVTLKGTASAQLVRGTGVRFEWGPTASYGHALPAGGVPVDSAAHGFAKRLTGLLPDVVYHARLVTTGPGGTVFGADTTFRTRKAQPALRLKSPLIAVDGTSLVGVQVVCPLTTTTCTGKVVLRRVNKRRTSLGSKAFAIAGGTTGTVSVRLSAKTRRLVKSAGVLKVKATLTAKDGDGVGFPTARRNARLVWNG